MNDLNRSMKLSLILGFSGAALMPWFYELFANVSELFALALLFIYSVTAGIKFSPLRTKEAFLGITCTVAYAGVFGWMCYLFVHPRVVKLLEKRSTYFALDLKHRGLFALYAFLLLMTIYIVWLAAGYCRRKLEDNGERAGKYVDSAFDDEYEKEGDFLYSKDEDE